MADMKCFKNTAFTQNSALALTPRLFKVIKYTIDLKNSSKYTLKLVFLGKRVIFFSIFLVTAESLIRVAAIFRVDIEIALLL